MSTALDTGENIITLVELKPYLGESTGASTAYDRRWNEIINTVSFQFNSYTNRLLKNRQITEYYDGDGSASLLTNQYPITSVSTNIDIRVNTDRSYTTTYKIDSTSIIIDSTEGLVRLDDDTFDAGDHSVKIVYNAGYFASGSTTTPTFPSDLKYAAYEMCRVLWDREKRNSVGRRAESFEGSAITYESAMPWSVKDVLDKYKDLSRTNG